MDRIFFAFPEKDKKHHRYSGSFFIPRKRDCLLLFHPERVKTINPKNPVDPVKRFFSTGGGWSCKSCVMMCKLCICRAWPEQRGTLVLQ
jgi:hypothetical protein